MKATKLMKNKNVKMFTLKSIILLSITIVTLTGIYIDLISIPKLKDALLLCKTYLIIIEVGIESGVSTLYLVIFVQVKRTVLSEDRSNEYE